MAIKSGMLAAETIFEALCAGDTSAAKRSAPIPQKVEAELDQKRTVGRAQFPSGISQTASIRGLVHAGLQFVTGGRGLIDPMHAEAGYKDYHKLNRDRALVDQSTRFKGDGKLTFDRLTDVYHSGTRHEEDQPCHLIVLDPNICVDRCVRRIRQSLPVFLSRRRLRNGRGKRQRQTENQRRQLRPLQDLRHRRPLPDHRLGSPRRRRRPQLRRHVNRDSRLAILKIAIGNYRGGGEILKIVSDCTGVPRQVAG